jgi:hypothetical protein
MAGLNRKKFFNNKLVKWVTKFPAIPIRHIRHIRRVAPYAIGFAIGIAAVIRF